MDREKIALENFEQGLNCAQSVFCVFAQEGGLSREKALLISSCFGGGMRCGEVCGAVTGALMAIGLDFGFTSMQNPADKARSNTLAVSFEKQFIAKKQSILCRELLGYDLSDSEEFMQITEQGLFGSICPQLISEAVRIVEKIFTDEKKENYTETNARAWDKWVDDGIEWGIPVSHEDYINAKKGNWGVYLTPTKFVPEKWFLPFEGAQLLGLASGGGQQMPVFSALGARCTIFDYSDKQLESERMVAEREGYEINIIKGDMTKRLPFADNSFDMIFHPVSNCYIEDVYHVWNECYRILKKGGVLLAGLDNGINFLFNDYEKLIVENKLPFNPLKDPALYEMLMADDSGVQFSHSLEEQIGGQLKAGLCLTDLIDDYDRPGNGRLCEFTPTYIATRAVKI